MSERGGTPSRSAAVTLVAIAAVTAVATVGALAFLVPDPAFRTMKDLATDGPPVTAQAMERRTDLAAPGEITLVWEAGDRIEYAGEPGVITVAPDGVTCGQAYLSVNDLPRFALCSDFPLWRPLNSSSRGSDMNILLDFLRAGGHLGPEATSRESIRQAIVGLQKASGWPQTGVIGPDVVVWVRDATRPATPLVAVGDRVVSGDLLSEQPAVLVSATLLAEVGDDAWRFVPVDHPVELVIGEDGSVGNVRELEAAILTSGAPAPLPAVLGGTARLAEELVTLAVPAAAIIEGDDGLCVYIQGSGPAADPAVEVEIVDYRLGTAFVRGDLKAGDVVSLEPRSGC